MKLYGHVNNKSSSTLKIRAALAEAGVPFDLVPVDLDKGEQKTPAFLTINPHGKIPVLVDGDFALPESNAILWYLADAYPAAKLWGAVHASHCYATSPLLRRNKNLPSHATSHIVSMT